MGSQNLFKGAHDVLSSVHKVAEVFGQHDAQQVVDFLGSEAVRPMLFDAFSKGMNEMRSTYRLSVVRRHCSGPGRKATFSCAKVPSLI